MSDERDSDIADDEDEESDEDESNHEDMVFRLNVVSETFSWTIRNISSRLAVRRLICSGPHHIYYYPSHGYAFGTSHSFVMKLSFHKGDLFAWFYIAQFDRKLI
jgi:hypothetical protein